MLLQDVWENNFDTLEIFPLVEITFQLLKSDLQLSLILIW